MKHVFAAFFAAAWLVVLAACSVEDPSATRDTPDDLGTTQEAVNPSYARYYFSTSGQGSALGFTIDSGWSWVAVRAWGTSSPYSLLSPVGVSGSHGSGSINFTANKDYEVVFSDQQITQKILDDTLNPTDQAHHADSRIHFTVGGFTHEDGDPPPHPPLSAFNMTDVKQVN